MEQNVINSENTDLLRARAVNEKSKGLTEAIEIYQTALNQDQTNYSAYTKLGALYEQMNDTEKAKDVYVQGIKTARSFQNKVAETNLSYTLLGLMELTM